MRFLGRKQEKIICFGKMEPTARAWRSLCHEDFSTLPLGKGATASVEKDDAGFLLNLGLRKKRWIEIFGGKGR